MRIQPSLSDRFLISLKHNLLFCILYTFFSIFQKKETEKTRKSKKEKNAYLYTGRQEIISSLVRYVTAHDTHAIRKSSSGKKSYLTSEIFHSS